MRSVRAKTFITFHVTLYIAQHVQEMNNMYIPMISEMVDIQQRAKRSRDLVRELSEFEGRWYNGKKK